ncbi:DUF1294 domain-containing protein [Cognatilysobacter tabacisoli]|jgi:uncharacterized membrane protein YsdA (DUF1294 family)/cold shock CspA family protein|uniref:DUF1294 domain-containing protein n=1 Tax=Cognatilysobacter tabacisoli TaxID=2315424 RepID=UPI000E6AF1E7|nr:DUF1294 domain-containing protein [Lysobacter tabacisoli]
MRYVGRLADWNDDKGFGFVTPHGGGDRAFVHIRAFERAVRRPVDGELLSYAVVRDARGRLNASAVRFAGQVSSASRRPRTPDALWYALAAAFLGFLALGAALGRVPWLIAAVYAVASVIAFGAYGFDKAAARRGGQRTPEATLHLIDVIGGWPGALVAQRRYRHKSTKAAFQSTFWFTVAVNVAGLAWLLAGGGATVLDGMLLGR